MYQDKRHGSIQWRDATRAEIGRLGGYDTFKNLDKKYPLPVGYKKIRIHFVYDANHY